MIIDNAIRNTIWELVSKAENIGLAGHVRPDGDCIGACLAMYNYIRKVYPDKKVYPYLEPVGDIFLFLKNSDRLISSYDRNDLDLFISLDCSSKDRLGDAAALFDNASSTIVIDHHVTNTSFGDINCFDGDRSSTCEVLFELFDESYIDKHIAECLYTGIIHDTGVLKYSNTSKRTLEITGKLIDKKIDFTKIIDESFYEKTYTQNRLLGRCLVESRLMFEDMLVFSEATEEIMNEYGAVDADLDGIVSSLLLTKGVECAILVHQMGPNEYKMSFRSKKYLDVSKIAFSLGGGGHVRAAGCTVVGEHDEELNKVFDMFRSELDNIRE